MRRWLLQNWRVGLTLGLIIVIYLVVRIPNLTSQPIFADEAIYIRWAQVMRSEPSLRFVSLTDGKTPLFMWLMIPMFKLIADPLLAGRLLSVVSGMITLIGVMVLGGYFFNRRVGLWSGWLIAVVPYLIFFDRMALVDSMLAAFGVWSVVAGLFLVRYERFDLAMLLGYLMGGGILTKTPGYFNVLVAPLVLVTAPWKKLKGVWRKLKIIGLVLAAMGIAMAVYNLLRLGPGFSSLSSRNGDYVHPISRLWQIPFDPFIPHLKDMSEWFPVLLGWPVLILLVIGIWNVVIKRNLTGLVIFGWAVIPLIAEVALLKTFTTRYILPAIPLLLVIAAYGADWVVKKWNRRWLEICLVLIVALNGIRFVYWQQAAPENTPLPVESRRGYFEDWTAGYGLREIAQLLEAESKSKSILIGTGGTFGTLPDGLAIYFDKNSNVSFASGNDFYFQELRKVAGIKETYFVVNSKTVATDPDGLVLVGRYPKRAGDGLSLETRLYKVLPEK